MDFVYVYYYVPWKIGNSKLLCVLWPLTSLDLYHLTGQRDKESAAREQRTEIEKILKEGERESERE